MLVVFWGILHSVYHSLAIFSRSYSVDGSRWVPFSKLGGERNEGGCVGGWTGSSDNEGNWAQKLVLESSSRKDDPASVIKQRGKGLITGFRDKSAERSDIYYAGRVEVWTISSTLEVQGAGCRVQGAGAGCRVQGRWGAQGSRPAPGHHPAKRLSKAASEPAGRDSPLAVPPLSYIRFSTLFSLSLRNLSVFREILYFSIVYP